MHVGREVVELLLNDRQSQLMLLSRLHVCQGHLALCQILHRLPQSALVVQSAAP